MNKPKFKEGDIVINTVNQHSYTILHGPLTFGNIYYYRLNNDGYVQEHDIEFEYIVNSPLYKVINE